MRKLGFLLVLLIALAICSFGLATNAYADTCTNPKKYTSCAENYYMTYNGSYNGTPTGGNACTVCPTGCTCAGGTDAPVCTITYKSGSTTLGSQTCNYGESVTLKNVSTMSSVPSSSYGWSIYGWGTSSNTSTRTYTNAQTGVTCSGMTLYGIWNRSLTFNYYNSASTTSVTTNTRTQYLYNGSAQAVVAYQLYTNTSLGWAATGWVTSSSVTCSTTPAYSQTATSGQPASINPGITSSATSYYALYQRTPVIVYNSNGGSGSTSPSDCGVQKIAAGGTACAPTCVLSQNGFTAPTNKRFSKWAMGSTTGTQYTAGSNYSYPNTTYNTTVNYDAYAIWVDNTATVTVAAGNGYSKVSASGWTGTGGTSMTKTFNIGDTITLTSISGTRKTGYTGTRYTVNGTAISNPYTVTGAVTINVEATGITAPSLTLTPNNPDKIYNYEATNLVITNSTSYDSAIKLYWRMGTSDLVAPDAGTDGVNYTWTNNNTYSTNSDSTNSVTVSQNTSITKAITKNEYLGKKVFRFYVYAGDGTLTSGDGEHLFSALTLRNMAITFNATNNGGTLSGTSPLYAQYSNATLYTTKGGTTAGTVPTATKANATFNGWYTAASGGSQIYNASGTLTSSSVSGYTSSSKWVTTQERTLYAQFSCNTGYHASGTSCVANTCSVKFQTGGNTMGTQSGFTYGTSKALTNVSSLSGGPSSTYGWEFYGWATSYGTSTRTYTNAQSVSNICTTDGGTVTLYGLWSRPVTIKYYNSATTTTLTSTTARGPQYYRNSSASAAGPVGISSYRLYNNTTYGWTALGWRYDTTASGSVDVEQTSSTTTSTGKTVTPPANGAGVVNAVYSRTPQLAYQPNGASNGSMSNSSCPTQYYNAGGTGSTPSCLVSDNEYDPPAGMRFYRWAAGSTSGDLYDETDYMDYPNTSYDSAKTYDMYAIWVNDTATITVTAGRGYSAVSATGWTNTGTASMSKVFNIGDTITLSNIGGTLKSGYSGIKYLVNGTAITGTYTVTGAVTITVEATGITTPTASITANSTTTKTFNYSDTTFTAASPGTYDSGITVYYKFGWAASTSTTTPTSGFTYESDWHTTNTYVVAKDARRNYTHVKVQVYATDGTLTSTTATYSSSRYIRLINRTLTFDVASNSGTISGTSPLYTAYGNGSLYTSATGSTTGSMPSATKSNNVFTGWYTAASSGTKVVNADGTLTGSAVTNYTNASKQWVMTANQTVYAQFGACSCTKGTNVSACTVTGVTSNKCQYSYTCTAGYNNGGNTSGTFEGAAATASNTSPSCASKNTYTITVTAGRGVSTVAATGWTNTGTATMTKTYSYLDTIDLSSVVTPTNKTGYTGAAYAVTSGSGSISSNTFTVGTGNGTITVTATGISAPTSVTITGGTTKTYNQSATTLTGSQATSYDSGITVYYNFGSTATATSSTCSGSYTYGTASSTATTSVAKDAFRGYKCYKVKVYASDGTLTSSTVEASTATTMGLINRKLTFNISSNGGTIGTGTSPAYTYYQNGSVYTTATGSTTGTIPAATKSGAVFNGWYSAASGGSKVINANGTLTGSAVSGYTNASKQWVMTGDKTVYAQFSACAACVNGTGAQNCSMTVSNNTCTYAATCKTGYSTTGGANPSGTAATCSGATCSCQPNYYEITLDYTTNGGSTSEFSKLYTIYNTGVYHDAEREEDWEYYLGMPEKANASFEGWFSAATGGTQYTNSIGDTTTDGDTAALTSMGSTWYAQFDCDPGWRAAGTRISGACIGEVTVTAGGNTKQYDGNSLSCTGNLSVVDGDAQPLTGYTVEYSTNGGTSYSTTVPTITNVADSKTINYRVSKTGYETKTGTFSCTITKAPCTVTLGATSGTITYPTATKTTTATTSSGGTLSATVANINSVNMISRAPEGSWTSNGLTVTTSGDGIYKINGTTTAETTIKIPITQFTIPTSVAKGGTGSIFLGTTFSTGSCSFKFYNGTTAVETWNMNAVNRFASSYTSMVGKTPNYIAIYCPSGTTITSGEMKPAIYNDSRTAAGDFVAGNPYDASANATATISSGTLTMTAVHSGKSTVTVTSAETANYNSCSATYTLEALDKKVTVSSNGGSGTCVGGYIMCTYEGGCNAPTWSAQTCAITNGTGTSSKVLTGWNTNSAGSGTSVALGGSAANVSELYAVWTACTCGTDTNATCAVQTSSANVCQYKHTCTLGYYNANNGATGTSNTMTCTQCGTNKYCPSGATSESNCPTAYSKSAAGSSSQNDCYLTLTAGQYVATAGAGATVCGANTWSTSTANIYYGGTVSGRSTTSTCTSCTSGYTTSGTAASNHDAKSDCTISITLNKNGSTGTIQGTTGTANASVTCQEGVACDFGDASGLVPTSGGYKMAGGWGTANSCTATTTSFTTPTTTTYYACKSTCSYTNSTAATPSSNVCAGTCNTGYSTSGGSNTGTAASCSGTTCTCSARDYAINYTLNGGEIPSGYTPVEYIQSAGAAYIDTGIAPSDSFIHEMVFNLPSTSSSQLYICGTGASTGRGGNVRVKNSTIDGIFIGTSSALNILSGTPSVTSGRNTLVLNLNHNVATSVYLNSTSVGTGGSSTVTSTDHLLLGRSTAGTNGAAVRFYSDKITMGGTVIRNFIPVRNSSNVCGMYDTVNGTFYKSASSTNFTCPSTTGLPSGYTYGVGASVTGTPARANSTFAGWCTDAALTTCAATQSVSTTDNGDKTYYAKWTCNTGYTANAAGTACVANTYTIAYNSNKPSAATANVSGTTASSTHTYDTPKNLTSNGYSLTGWTFQGWSTSASSSTVVYTNGQSVNNLTATAGATITLYAVWTQNCNAITLNANDGTAGSVTTLYKKTDATGWYSNNTCTTAWTSGTNVKPSRSGYTFRGFYSADLADATADATNGTQYITTAGATTTAGTNWTVNAAKTIYAAWATNCPSSVANGSCELSVSTAGAVDYTTSCNTGYTISGNNTSNPVCTAQTSTVTLKNGSTTVDTVTATYDAAMPTKNTSNANLTMPTSTNAVFMGYYDATTGGTQYYTAALASARTWNKTGAQTLNAQFASCTCTKGTGVSSCTPSGVSVNKCQYSVTCEAGYSQSGGTPSTRTFTATNGTAATAAYTANCVKNSVITVTLDSKYYASSSATSGTAVTTNAAPTTIYEWYDKGWYKESGTSTAFTALTTKPAYTTYVFGGFYTGKAGTGDQIIDASGNIVSGTEKKLTANGTIYAKWTACTCGTDTNATCEVMTTSNNTCQYKHTCTAGYYNANSGATVTSNTMTCTQCSAGKYCPEGSTSESSCPTNWTSAAGASAQTQCYRNIVMNKNGMSGTLTLPSGSGCKSIGGATGATNDTLVVYYNTACTLPTTALSGTATGTTYTGTTSWATSANAASGFVTSITTTSTDATITYYAGKKYTCAGGYYLAASTNGACSTCTDGNYCPGVSNVYYSSSVQGVNSCTTNTGTLYTHSGTGSADTIARNDIGDCYVTTTAGKYIAEANDNTETTCPTSFYCPSASVYWGTTGSKLNCNDGSASGTAEAPWTSDAGATARTSCYRDVTLSKNSMSGTLTPVENSGCKSYTSNEGTTSDVVTVYYNTACKLPDSTALSRAASGTTSGLAGDGKWSLSATATSSTTGTNALRDTITITGTGDSIVYYAGRKMSCNAGYYLAKNATTACTSCTAGYYCTGTAAGYYSTSARGLTAQCKNAIATGWTSKAGAPSKEYCYYPVTVNKNGYSFTIAAGTFDSTTRNCIIDAKKTGTTAAVLRLYWNADCTLPSVGSRAQTGYTNGTAWAASNAIDAETITTLAKVSDNSVPAITTIYVQKPSCLANYYKSAASTCSLCSGVGDGGYNKSVAGNKTDEYVCYAAVTINKNNYSGSITAPENSGCEIDSNSGTTNATVHLHYNTACTLPTIAQTTQSPYIFEGLATSANIGAAAVSTSIAASTENPAVTTYYVRKIMCADNSYKSGDATCAACPTAYPNNAAGTSSQDACYLTTTATKYVATAGAGQVNCAAGGYCPGGVVIYYSGTHSSEHPTTGGRTACPANSYCVAAVSAPTSCATTNSKYPKSAAESDDANDCYLTTTATKYVAEVGAGEVACVAGGYCAGGSDIYVGGTVSGRNTTGGIAVCADNTYSAASASSCTACATANGYTNSGSTYADHATIASCTTTCAPGQYVATAGAACANVGAGNWGEGGTVAQNATLPRTACATGLTTIGYGMGADAAADCGHKFHVGENIVYLRSVKRTNPSLNVKIGGTTFYGNMGTTERNMSVDQNKKLKVKDSGTTYYVYDDSIGQEPEIPSDYTVVPYISTNSNAYIDTTMTVNSFDRVVTNVKLYDYKTETGKTDYPSLFGATASATSGSNNAKTFRFYNNGSSFTCSYGDTWGSSWSTPPSGSFPLNAFTDLDVKLAAGEQYIKINGVTKAAATLTKTLTNNYNVTIFAFNYAGNKRYKPHVDCKGMTFYKGDDVVLNLVPVRRNSDSKCGMYDTVHKTFYGSAISTNFTCP